jgi:integrase
MMDLTTALEHTTRNRFGPQKDGERAVARAQRCIAFLGPQRLAKRVREPDLRRMLLAMRESGLGPASINRHLSALSAVLEEAGVQLAMPWQREPKGRTRWLSDGEVLLLQSALSGSPTVAALVAFLAETGLRVGEALRLRWEDIELVQRPRVVVRLSKNGDQRVVPLTATAVRTVSLMASRVDGPWWGLSQSRVNHTFRAARDSIESMRGDREIVPHALRHTAASRLIRAGVPAPTLQAWLGHRDYRSTLRYVHVGDESLAAAARMLEDAR